MMGSVCGMGRCDCFGKNARCTDGVVLMYLMLNFSGGMYASIYDGSLF